MFQTSVVFLIRAISHGILRNPLGSHLANIRGILPVAAFIYASPYFRYRLNNRFYYCLKDSWEYCVQIVHIV